MSKNLHYIILFLSLFLSLSCTKTDVEVITGNTAPQDSTIETVVLETYVNKLYITVLGRKPSDSEQADGMSILQSDNVSEESRKELIELLFDQEEYYDRIYAVAFNDLLPSIDSNYFEIMADQIEGYLEKTTDPAFIEYYENELVCIEAVLNILYDFENNNLTVSDMQKRLIRNFGYDELNMGTENFIVSLFQYFLFRYPTESELANSTLMVDGSNSVVFYEEGNSKEDFIDIFFAGDEYYEGQVRYLYQRYLYREPTSEEMTSLANAYKNSGDYQALQKTILISDEYAGILYN
jgi:hypothetical protein